MNDPTRVKTCTKCGEPKPLDAFAKDKQKRDGLTPRCKACRRADDRRYMSSEASKEKARERLRRHMQTERGQETRKRYVESTPEKQRAYKIAYRARHPDAARLYYEANKIASYERVMKRRALQRSVTVGDVDIARLWADARGICGICAEPINYALNFPDPMSRSVDHIVPLSKGGTHEQANLQAAHLVCNIKKGAKVPVTDLAV